MPLTSLIFWLDRIPLASNITDLLADCQISNYSSSTNQNNQNSKEVWKFTSFSIPIRFGHGKRGEKAKRDAE